MAINLFRTTESELSQMSTRREPVQIPQQTNRSKHIKTEASLRQKEANLFSDDAKSLKFENVPYGAAINSAKNPATITTTTTTNSSNHHLNKGEYSLKKRTTLKEEIIIHNQFKVTVPTYFNRKNFDLMRIVEDQVSLRFFFGGGDKCFYSSFKKLKIFF